MREKIGFFISAVIWATAIVMTVTDKNAFWASVAFGADPWREIIVKKIEKDHSYFMIHVLIIETFATSILCFKTLMEIVV
jgi:hypothetical protein